MVTTRVSPYQEYRDKPDVLVDFLVEKDHEIAKLQRILYNLQKSQFGSRSEKRLVDPADDKQLLLASEEALVEAAAVIPEKEIEIASHTRKKRVKRDLSKLPHNEVILEPESTVCPCCDAQMSRIGEDTSTELEYQPAKLSVNKYIRPRYGCNSCKQAGIHQASLPEGVKPLPRSIASAGLLANIIVSKYNDHLPLHRQEQIFTRLGFQIPRKNMCNWVGGVVDEYGYRLWSALKTETLEERYVQADETTLKVQDGENSGKCHLGYLWAMACPEKKIVAFEYAPSRAGAVAKEIFSGFEGILQTDAYAGYNPVILPEKVNRIACLAHVRRKFIDAGKSCSKQADAVLRFIAELYRLEKNWEDLKPADRLLQRLKKSVPILEKLHHYLCQLLTCTLPKAPLMEAIKYTLNQWTEIKRIFQTGETHLDNNMIEREMRPIALGRKNYLFAGSHEGAKRAAVIYSLFATARLHKVNPYQWLTDVLKRMHAHPVNSIAELLPHKWKKLPAR